ncbi:MAG: hypothetical protein P8J87_00695 [Verrucomicrobiales bacterium]|nr:hypothetical protein [Verrucomicrobiales bacterium]
MSGRSMRVTDCALTFLEVPMRVPLKFGAQTVTGVTCARVCVRVRGADGREATGWGETPLSVAWVWPSALGYEERNERLKGMTVKIAGALKVGDGGEGHAFEIGYDFIKGRLGELEAGENAGRESGETMPHLAVLVSFSAFDLALHDAFGNLHGVPVYETYTGEWMGRDLAWYFGDEAFEGKYPGDYLEAGKETLPVWHLVGGLDPLDESELTGEEPDDGYPVMLRDWIRRDGLDCLKIKLRGNDAEWDYERLVKIGKMAQREGCGYLTTDFNCTVTDPAYVNEILDRLKIEEKAIWDAILYVEQPFPYDLKANQIDVHSVSERKPLYMDESAHDWTYVRLGKSLGWTGVALKTCKTQTGALLSLCWAKANGMGLMVQDLTNPMLAQVPHALLAAHAGTIMGVESNGMQFYPDASLPEAEVHPGLYRRRGGVLDLGTLSGSGFGYRVGEIVRALPGAAVEFG